MATKLLKFFIAAKILSMLAKPFNKTPQFKAGIIDEKGVQIVPNKDLSPTQRNSFDIIDKLVLKLKRAVSANRLLSLGSAMLLLKDDIDPYILYEVEEILLEDAPTNVSGGVATTDGPIMGIVRRSKSLKKKKKKKIKKFKTAEKY